MNDHEEQSGSEGIPVEGTRKRDRGAPQPPAETFEPAQLPAGFWARVDYLLTHPSEVLESIRRDQDLVPLSAAFFAISLVMAAIYGVIMGATNLFQASIMTMEGKILFIPITAIKVPCLFLLTFAIVWPPIYVSNAFMGARNSWRQITAMLLGATAISTTVLASMFTVALFFTLTSRSYHFIKLMHVVFFAYAGLTGIAFLEKCLVHLNVSRRVRSSGGLAVIWLLLYVFVGTQLAWVMRPFVGSPNEKFQVFRPRQGNFYESILQSAREVRKH
jgi:hypothetical protein